MLKAVRSLRIKTFAPVILTALAAGCGSDGVAPPQADAGKQASVQPPTVVSNAAGQAAKPLVAAKIPDGAKYTIVCTAFGGAGHIAQSTAMKDKLVAATGRGDFYLVHEEGMSTLYFGYYKAIEKVVDPVEAKRADDDFAYVRSLVDAAGHKLFPKSLKEVLPVADPEGPPEYDLTKLDRDKAPTDPTRRYWSIAIAAYTVDAVATGTDAGKNRKQLAVESVLAARKQGIEAYYYNGENVSTVCIGAWPRAAIAEQENNEAKSNTDSNQAIIVSASPLPPGLAEQLENSGKNVKVFQPKIDIVDPTMLSTWKEFPQYVVNGEAQNNRITDPKTGKSEVKPQPTFLVEIPRLQPSVISNTDTAAQDNSGPPTMINPLGPGTGGGQLRSLTK